MYQQFLQEVQDQQRHYGEQTHPPSDEAALASLSQNSLAELSADVPEQYKAFLRITDGLNWNGLFIYSSHDTSEYKHGFVETNLNWRSYEINQDFLFFADADINLYAYSISEEEYQVLDRPSMDVYDSFQTFDELIADALKGCLL